MTIYMTFDTGIDMAKFKRNRLKAQYWLDNEVMNDIVPYMPRVTGTFINTTRMKSAAMAGTGEVCIGTAPMGQYLYYGKVMVDSATGKGARPIKLKSGEVIFRHRLGAKLVPTGRNLTWSDPNTQPRWFEYAAELNKEKWLRGFMEVLLRG